MPFELSILHGLQEQLGCGPLDALMPLITVLGNGGALWIISAALLLVRPKTRHLGAAMALSLALEALLCNGLLKPLAARPRPFMTDPSVTLLISPPGEFSFPSGHTGASFAAAASLYFEKSRLWRPASVLAVLIGFSRLYLFVHYPSDVLAGAVLGIATGWIGSRTLRQLQAHSARR